MFTLKFNTRYGNIHKYKITGAKFSVDLCRELTYVTVSMIKE